MDLEDAELDFLAARLLTYLEILRALKRGEKVLFTIIKDEISLCEKGVKLLEPK